MNLIETFEQWTKAYPDTIFTPLTADERKQLIQDHPGLIDRISAAMGRHMVEMTLKPAIAEMKYMQSRIDSLMLEYCPEGMTDEQIENLKMAQVSSTQSSVTQPETNEQ